MDLNGMHHVLLAATGNEIVLWPVILFTVIVFILAGGMIGVSFLLGERHEDKSTNEVYESGVKITGSARQRFSSHFYLVAMFFVIFDLEAAFIIAWAIAFKQVGWFGFIGASVFIGILCVVLVYEWRIGALDFGPSSKKILKAYHEKVKDSKILKQLKKKSA